ncbi:ATP-binding cassette domain-containing protein [Salinibacterium sp. ZJ77]|uniref:ABC transporter ATP-binding protein n=1 Tax=Salinibacterium sp. ZJ77 TaxID=2708337 RepID=UPI001FBB7A70|nr:ATP-binding cassette domain-containing protein [Salinibacterium sp. ZJ77]
MRGIRKSFGDHHVLRGIDLDVARGEIVALLGPNGSGKTTALGILTTLVHPDAGTATIDDIDVVAHPREVQRRIGVTGQSAAVDGVLTGAENLRMLAALSGFRGRAARDRAAEMLELFGLADAAHRRVGSYSGGMRRRLDLALSLIAPTPVVFLDEPTTGLDARSRRELWEIIARLASDGTTVMLTTQYLEEADQLADRVLVLHEGRIVADGTPADLKARVGDDVIEVVDDSGVPIASRSADGTLAGLRRALDELAASGVEGRVSLRTPSLDDVFLALTAATAPQPLLATASEEHR